MLKPSHLRYCELVAGGTAPPAAYAEACCKPGKNMTKVAAWKGSERLSINVECQEEISRIREAANKLAGSAVLGLQETLETLARIVRTPLGDLNENHPLCQKLKRTKPHKKPEEGEQLELWVTEEVAKPDLLKALEMNAKLQGFFSEDRLNNAMSDGLEELLEDL